MDYYLFRNNKNHHSSSDNARAHHHHVEVPVALHLIPKHLTNEFNQQQ